MKSEVIAYVENFKAKRLERERETLALARRVPAMEFLRSYKNTLLPMTDILPDPADFWAFPEVQAIRYLPLDVGVTSASFDHLIPLMPDIISRWRTEIHDKFASKRLPVDAIARKLASTVYRCAGCVKDRLRPIEPLFYPLVLGHRCNTSKSGYTTGALFLTDMDFVPRFGEGAMLSETQRERTPHTLRFEYDETLSRLAKEVIVVCGQDPTIITAEDMDKLDARVGCLSCIEWDRDDSSEGVYEDAEEDPDEEREIAVRAFKWRNAVSYIFCSFGLVLTVPLQVKHAAIQHSTPGAVAPNWVLLPENQLEEARDFDQYVEELAEYDTDGVHRNVRSLPRVFTCGLCRDTRKETAPMDKCDLEYHFEKEYVFLSSYPMSLL